MGKREKERKNAARKLKSRKRDGNKLSTHYFSLFIL
jgi:hypothetical protein